MRKMHYDTPSHKRRLWLGKESFQAGQQKAREMMETGSGSAIGEAAWAHRRGGSEKKKGRLQGKGVPFP